MKMFCEKVAEIISDVPALFRISMILCYCHVLLYFVVAGAF